jgi:hypothetical protein
MESWQLGAIIGGIGGALAGGIGAYRKVSRLNQEVRSHLCPQCAGPAKAGGPRTWTQVLWGGWTCPECGCDVDRFGKERSKQSAS